ncbi:hypothetical protein CLV78_103255 [Aliiruegeria haliotis]|uniref:Uncharacterized protein n=2 Tax=Aliiruegeria haliotis TaxID=1280846 RepID=A0A2T0RT58_9RHOB|nr:hypothetical protein CLV78_103255 [Aliiruegeria haliotis]
MSLASTDPLAGGHGAKDALDTGNGNTEFVKLNNQFIVPVIEDGRVRSMVVMSLAVETATGAKEQVYEREPVLRDKFLQVLFEHANAGRFDGNFTSTRNLDLLRRSLREEARLHFGNLVVGVLVTDIARQDV